MKIEKSPYGESGCFVRMTGRSHQEGSMIRLATRGDLGFLGCESISIPHFFGLRGSFGS
jgi:hypothetical protein